MAVNSNESDTQPPGTDPHQRTVYEGLVFGYSNKRIAADMGVSEKSVKCYVTRILKKTLCIGRVELIVSHYQGHVILKEYHPHGPVQHGPDSLGQSRQGNHSEAGPRSGPARSVGS